jgi:purine-cytosine permease-like protein
MTTTSTKELIEDHALEKVPQGERHTWLDISWNTVGIVTTLIQLYVGALVTFVAGIKIGLLSGLIVAVIGGLLGWGTGHIAYKSGLASGVMSRLYGFGIKGSVVASSIFGFMIIGFIAAENVLLYKGFLFYFNAENTLVNQLVIYGLLTAAWIILTTYGFDVVTKVSSYMLVGFLIVLFYMMAQILSSSSQPWQEIVSFGSQFPMPVLKSLGADTDLGKLIFGVNLLAGSAGALALLDADLGRYARSSTDIGIAAFLGNFALDVFMIFMGAVIMYAGMPALTEYYISVMGIGEAEAARIAIENPDRVAAAFIVFGGILGTILMVLAQSKAQVLNTYSSSLSLANLCDAIFSWQPGRFVFVVLANVLSLFFLYGELLTWFNSFLVVLGILTMSFAGIMMADYFIVRPRLRQEDTDVYGAESVNWAGICSIPIAFVLSHYVLNSIITIEIFTALAVAFIGYPLLRIFIFKPVY